MKPRKQPPTLELGSPTTLVEAGAARIDERTWRFDDRTGWAWVGRWPRDARLTVHPSEGVQVLDRFPAVGEGEILVNGGFYDDGPMGLVRHRGADLAPLTEIGGSGVVVWGPDLPVAVLHRSAWTGQGTEGLQSIDRLVAEGQSVVRNRDDLRLAARAAVAVAEDAVLIVVAAGDASSTREEPTRIRLKGAEDDGLPLWAFADLLVAVGAIDALNLDGGISVEARARLGGREVQVVGAAGTIDAVRLSLP